MWSELHFHVINNFIRFPTDYIVHTIPVSRALAKPTYLHERFLLASDQVISFIAHSIASSSQQEFLNYFLRLEVGV